MPWRATRWPPGCNARPATSRSSPGAPLSASAPSAPRPRRGSGTAGKLDDKPSPAWRERVSLPRRRDSTGRAAAAGEERITRRVDPPRAPDLRGEVAAGEGFHDILPGQRTVMRHLEGAAAHGLADQDIAIRQDLRRA